jgi:hypothetical protein
VGLGVGPWNHLFLCLNGWIPPVRLWGRSLGPLGPSSPLPVRAIPGLGPAVPGGGLTRPRLVPTVPEGGRLAQAGDLRRSRVVPPVPEAGPSGPARGSTGPEADARRFQPLSVREGWARRG